MSTHTFLKASRILPAFLLAAACAPCATAAPPKAEEVWLGMYLGKLKVGYTHVRQEQVSFRGKTAIRTESSARTEMTVLGAKMTQDIRTTVHSDLETRPIYQEFEMSSGGKATKVTAEFGADAIECKLRTEAGDTSKRIPIPKGVSLVGDSYTPLQGEEMAVGAKYERKAFNPLTLTLDDLTIQVEREETIVHAGRKVAVLVVQTKTPVADLTTYQSKADGQPVRIEAAMGITMVREPREQAMGIQPAEYRPPQDFAVLTSVRANMDLPDDGKLQSLDIRISGLPDKGFVLTDQRQQVQGDGKGVTDGVTFLIRASRFVESRSALLPVTDASLQSYLKPASYIDSDAASIREQAQKIVGSEKNLYRASSLIREWVSARMKPKSDMGILRPASDVLKSPSGVCRDYAVLFAALARASGIPTRIIGGLVFSRGDFYYHAWNEVWTGGAWVPFDATVETDFVDATHIKLTEGDATDMFRLGKVIGQLKAEIIAYE